MGTTNNYTFSYDRCEMDIAMQKASDAMNCAEGLKSSVNGLSSSDGEIQAAIDGAKGQIESCFSELSSCENSLTNVKTIANAYMDEDASLSEDTFLNTYNSLKDYTRGKINYVTLEGSGQSGFIFVPEGDTTGKALITWINPTCYKSDLIKYGVGSLINNGEYYPEDAIIWIPLQEDGTWQTDNNRNKLVQSINTIIDSYNLDRDRNIVYGHSNGGYVASEIASLNPGLFSVALIAGGSTDPRNYPPITSEESKKTLWIYMEMRHEVSEGCSINSYNQVLANGGRAIKYQTIGYDNEHGHGASAAILTNPTILNDLINYRKDGDIPETGKGVTNSEGYYVIKKEDADSNDLDAWYVPISGNTAGTSQNTFSEKPVGATPQTTTPVTTPSTMPITSTQTSTASLPQTTPATSSPISTTTSTNTDASTPTSTIKSAPTTTVTSPPTSATISTSAPQTQVVSAITSTTPSASLSPTNSTTSSIVEPESTTIIEPQTNSQLTPNMQITSNIINIPIRTESVAQDSEKSPEFNTTEIGKDNQDVVYISEDVLNPTSSSIQEIKPTLEPKTTENIKDSSNTLKATGIVIGLGATIGTAIYGVNKATQKKNIDSENEKSNDNSENEESKINNYHAYEEAE